MNEKLVCPKCEQVDKIEKVSAIIAHQTRTRRETELRTETYTDFDGKSRTSTYTVPYDVVEATDLVKYFSLPPKPQAGNDLRGCVAIAGIFFIAALLFIFLWNFEDSLQNNRISANSSNLITWSIEGFVFFASLIILFFLYRGVSASYRNSTLRKKEENRHWEYAIQRREQSYYCYRDDIVFIPGLDEWSSSSQALRFFFLGVPITSTQEQNNSATVIIIAIVAVVLLCCCCIAGYVAWTYGDAILQALNF